MFVSYLAEKDGFDGQDLLAIAQEADKLRNYIPITEERLKFKKLIAMNAKPKDDTSYLSVPLFFIPGREFDACVVRLFS